MKIFATLASFTLLSLAISSACIAQDEVAAPSPEMLGKGIAQSSNMPRFIACCRGSFHLDGKKGNNLYRYLGIVWNEKMEQYKEDNNYVYFREVNFPNYRWAFSKLVDHHGNAWVFQRFPEHKSWHFFCRGCSVDLAKAALGTEKMRGK